MNLRLALAARAALFTGDFTTEPGRCQQWVREVVESVYAHRYDRYRAASAKAAAALWRRSPYLVTDGSLAIGDLVYKTKGSGGYGHVGIHVGDGHVAEDSSTGIGRIPGRGALGYRTIDEFDGANPHDVTVRLPDDRAWTISLGTSGTNIIPGTEIDDEGHAWTEVRRWAQALGLKPRLQGCFVYVGKAKVPGTVWIAGDTAVMQVRDLATAAGLKIAVAGRRLEVTR